MAEALALKSDLGRWDEGFGRVEGSTLSWYVNADDSTPRAQIELGKKTTVQKVQFGLRKNVFELDLGKNGKQFQFSANSDAARTAWVERICKAAGISPNGSSDKENGPRRAAVPGRVTGLQNLLQGLPGGASLGGGMLTEAQARERLQQKLMGKVSMHEVSDGTCMVCEKRMDTADQVPLKDGLSVHHDCLYCSKCACMVTPENCVIDTTAKILYCHEHDPALVSSPSGARQGISHNAVLSRPRVQGRRRRPTKRPVSTALQSDGILGGGLQGLHQEHDGQNSQHEEFEQKTDRQQDNVSSQEDDQSETPPDAQHRRGETGSAFSEGDFSQYHDMEDVGSHDPVAIDNFLDVESQTPEVVQPTENHPNAFQILLSSSSGKKYKKKKEKYQSVVIVCCEKAADKKQWTKAIANALELARLKEGLVDAQRVDMYAAIQAQMDIEAFEDTHQIEFESIAYICMKKKATQTAKKWVRGLVKLTMDKGFIAYSGLASSAKPLVQVENTIGNEFVDAFTGAPILFIKTPVPSIPVSSASVGKVNLQERPSSPVSAFGNNDDACLGDDHDVALPPPLPITTGVSTHSFGETRSASSSMSSEPSEQRMSRDRTLSEEGKSDGDDLYEYVSHDAGETGARAKWSSSSRVPPPLSPVDAEVYSLREAMRSSEAQQHSPTMASGKLSSTKYSSNKSKPEGRKAKKGLGASFKRVITASFHRKRRSESGSSTKSKDNENVIEEKDCATVKEDVAKEEEGDEENFSQGESHFDEKKKNSDSSSRGSRELRSHGVPPKPLVQAESVQRQQLDYLNYYDIDDEECDSDAGTLKDSSTKKTLSAPPSGVTYHRQPSASDYGDFVGTEPKNERSFEYINYAAERKPVAPLSSSDVQVHDATSQGDSNTITQEPKDTSAHTSPLVTTSSSPLASIPNTETSGPKQQNDITVQEGWPRRPSSSRGKALGRQQTDIDNADDQDSTGGSEGERTTGSNSSRYCEQAANSCCIL